MEKNKFYKINIILFIVMVISCILGFSMFFVNADTSSSNFKMESGATVRINQGTGIRFTAKISETIFSQVNNDENKSFGMIIAPSTYFKNDNNYLTDNYVNQIIANHTDVTEQNGILNNLVPYKKDNKIYISGSIKNIKFDNINKDFNGIAYIMTKNSDNSISYEYASSTLSENAFSISYLSACSLNDIDSEDTTTINILKNNVNRGLHKALNLQDTTDTVFPELSAKFNKTSLVLDEQTQLSYTLSSGETSFEFKSKSEWTSSNKNVLSITSNGLVTAKSVGKATISVEISGIGVFSKEINVIDNSSNIYLYANDKTVNIKDEIENVSGKLDGQFKYKYYNQNTLVLEKSDENLDLTLLPLNTDLTLKVFSVSGENEDLTKILNLFVFDGNVNTFTTDNLFDYTENYSNCWWHSDLLAHSDVVEFTDDSPLKDNNNIGKTGTFLKLTTNDEFPFRFMPIADVSDECLTAFDDKGYVIEYDVLLKSGDRYNFDVGFNSKKTSESSSSANWGLNYYWDKIRISIDDYLEIQEKALDGDFENNYLLGKQDKWINRQMEVYFSNLRIVRPTDLSTEKFVDFNSETFEDNWEGPNTNYFLRIENGTVVKDSTIAGKTETFANYKVSAETDGGSNGLCFISPTENVFVSDLKALTNYEIQLQILIYQLDAQGVEQTDSQSSSTYSIVTPTIMGSLISGDKQNGVPTYTGINCGEWTNITIELNAYIQCLINSWGSNIAEGGTYLLGFPYDSLQENANIDISVYLTEPKLVKKAENPDSIFSDDNVTTKTHKIIDADEITNPSATLSADVSRDIRVKGNKFAQEVRDNFVTNFEKSTDQMVHVASFCVIDGIIYMTYYANTSGSAEDPNFHTARLVYCSEDDLDNKTFIDVQSVGDMCSGSRVTAVYDTIIGQKDNNTLFILWTAEVNGNYYRLYRTFDVTTKTLGEVKVNRFKVGEIVNDYSVTGIKNALAENEIAYKNMYSDIGIMQKFTTRVENGETYFYTGSYCGDFNFIIKSKDFIVWEYVAQPDFANESKWENATYVLNDKVYYFVRQNDSSSYGFLTVYDLVSKTWNTPVLIEDCQSRSDFIYYDNNLYLFNAPNNRNTIQIVKINTENIANSEIILQAAMYSSCFYPFVQYYGDELAIAYTNNRQHITLAKFTLSKFLG